MKTSDAHNVQKQKKVEETLSLDEIYEVALAASKCGITKFKITGGEPLL